jgi:hypothetical protein
VIGRWFGDFLSPDYFDLFPERFAGSNDTGEVCKLDFEMVRQDGAQITVSFYGRVAFDDQDRFVRTVDEKISEKKGITLNPHILIGEDHQGVRQSRREWLELSFPRCQLLAEDRGEKPHD